MLVSSEEHLGRTNLAGATTTTAVPDSVATGCSPGLQTETRLLHNQNHRDEHAGTGCERAPRMLTLQDPQGLYRVPRTYADKFTNRQKLLHNRSKTFVKIVSMVHSDSTRVRSVTSRIWLLTKCVIHNVVTSSRRVNAAICISTVWSNRRPLHLHSHSA